MIKQKSILILLILINFSCNYEENKISIDKFYSNENKNKTEEFSFSNFDIEQWNKYTNEFVNYYSISGTNNEQPLKILWSLVENGKYRYNLFAALSKEYESTIFKHEIYVVEYINLRSTLLAPKIIYIFDTQNTFGLIIRKIDNTNEVKYKSEKLSKNKTQELLDRISKLKFQSPYFSINNTRGDGNFHSFELISKFNKHGVKIIYGELTYLFI